MGYFTRSLAMRDFSLATLFLWMICFLAALSNALNAEESVLRDGVFLAFFTSNFTRDRIF